MNNSNLFSEYQLGSITLKNRVVMAPMTRSRSINNIPGPLVAKYYEQRAEAGLIITEGISPSPNGLGYARIPGIFSKEQIEGWKLTTHAVHKKGGKIFLQMMHTGRVSHIENMPKGSKVLAPSSITMSGEMYTDSKGLLPHSRPEEMTIDEIQNTINEYVQSAANAIEAGFDGVEIHGANGYLIEQFINPNVNKRNDTYGGSVENRSRFALEIAQKMADTIGKDKTAIRLSPYGAFNDTGAFDTVDETFEYLASELGKIGIVYLHIVDHSPMGAPEVPASIKEKMRTHFGGSIILSGGYDKEKAETDLKANKGELVAFGRPFISNPDLVNRMKNNIELAVPDFHTFYTSGEKGYTDYPAAEKITA